MGQDKILFSDLMKIDDDLKRNELTYQYFNEDKRLNSLVGQVEFQTTMRAIDRLLKPDMTILDVGAGTGVYTLPLASRGYDLVAYEPSTVNYEIFKNEIEEEALNDKIRLYKKSSFDMHELPGDCFDLVLLFGPLYHLSNREDQLNTLQEAKRVAKPGAHILISFINHDMIPMTETIYDNEWFAGTTYDREQLRIHNKPFVFMTLDECNKLVEDADYIVKRRIAADGFAELLANQLNEMSSEAYQMYLKWHAHTCEKEELLGATNHLLFVCQVKGVVSNG